MDLERKITIFHAEIIKELKLDDKYIDNRFPWSNNFS